MAFGDIDLDGDDDVVFTLNNGILGGVAYISVLLNGSDAEFGESSELMMEYGWETSYVALADLDVDADLDLIATNAGNGSISVFFNDGTGQFGGRIDYAVGDQPRSILAADLDADADVDLAVLNVESDDVSLLLNNGDGTFAPEVRVDAVVVTDRGNGNLTFPYPGPYIAGADLDADGDIDLVVPSKGELRLLVNDGRAGFSLWPQTLDLIGANAYDITIGDFDLDGMPDLGVVLNGTPDTAVNILINKGGLAFADPVAYSASVYGSPGGTYYHVSIDAGDLDEDGDLDLVVGQENFPRNVVLRGNGDGTFGPMEPHNVFEGPWVVKLEDVTGDGHLDFVYLTEAYRSGLRIYANDGKGNLIEPDRISPFDLPLSGAHYRLAAGDLDGDGDVDLVNVKQDHDYQIVESFGDGAFTVHDDIVLATADLVFPAIGDMNGDGLADIVLADEGDFTEPGFIRVLLNEGELTFEPEPPVALDTEAGEVHLGDMDGDGDLDVVAWLSEPYPGDDFIPVERRVMVLLNDATGTLTPAYETVIASHNWTPSIGLDLGDLDGDGDLDVAAATGAKNQPAQLTALSNDGSGKLSIVWTTNVSPHPRSLRLRDLDGDNDLDIALLANHNFGADAVLLDPYLTIAMNDGSADFGITQSLIDPNVITDGQMVAEDLDGNGAVDLAVPTTYGSLIVHLNDGTGHFGPGVGYTGTEWSPANVAVDVDRDGRMDIIAGNFSRGEYMIFRNRSCACPADVNADGSLDILDFIAFQQAFIAGDTKADCDGDGVLTKPLDFICFQQRFIEGCR